MDIDPERLRIAGIAAEKTARALGKPATDRHHRGPAGSDPGRQLRDLLRAGRRHGDDLSGLRHPRPLRAAPDHRRHAGDRRHLPRTPYVSGNDGAGREHHHGRRAALPAAQLYQPDGDEHAGAAARRRTSPRSGLCHSVQGTAAKLAGIARRRRGRGALPLRGHQPHGVLHRVPRRRPRPLPGAVQAPARRSGRTGPHRAVRDAQAYRLLRDRKLGAPGRVHAVLHPPRRGDHRPIPRAAERADSPPRRPGGRVGAAAARVLRPRPRGGHQTAEPRVLGRSSSRRSRPACRPPSTATC